MPGYVPAMFVNDIAIVVFNSPPAISAVGLDDGDTVPGPSTRVTTIGYGTPSIGVRKWATEIVTGSSSRWLDLKYGSGNSCIADSGGPDLFIPDRTIRPRPLYSPSPIRAPAASTRTTS
jgi:hypothetical protein